MIKIDSTELDFKSLNEKIRSADGDVEIDNCLGQRFIAAGFSKKNIVINGIPGNALGSYLNGAEIAVNGNAQDAVGDTMNDGCICIDGNVGDAVGYAMRGGRILVKGNAGYRAGIHMKEYKDKCPVIVIGGKCGSFLGEYQAGGIIIVLGLSKNERPIVSNFPCTGMHGGKIFFRSDCKDVDFPGNVISSKATEEDLKPIEKYILDFCDRFGYDFGEIMNSEFTKAEPNSNNPYKQMYVAN